jgi:heptosyltransferase-2
LKQTHYKHILVSRTDGLGDLILSLPVFQTLKATYAQASITALVNPYTADLIRNCPFIDSIQSYVPTMSMHQVLHQFRQSKFDLYIALFPRPVLAWASWQSGIATRVGTAYRWYSIFFNKKIYVHRSECLRHESDYNLDALRILGIHNMKTNITISLPKKDRDYATQLLKIKKISKMRKLIIIHPGSKNSALNWNEHRYRDIIFQLCKNKKLQVLLTGSPPEKKLIVDILKGLPILPKAQVPAVIAGETTMLQLAAVLQHADCFVSSSTGPMHLAAAMKIPTVSLFGPVATTTPVRWGPLGNVHRIFMPEHVECYQCLKGQCKQHDVMDQIPVSKVFKTVLDLVHLHNDL